MMQISELYWSVSYMKRNSRLSLALHTLGHMAMDPDGAQTSTEIAEHAGTNPVVVRRVLGRLREAGLLTSEKGHSGGWKLARAPEEITLADVFSALDEQLFSYDDNTEPANCAVERAMRQRISSVMTDIEQKLVDQLNSISINEMRN